MDWGSLVARRSKKDPGDQGGWNIFPHGLGGGGHHESTSAPLGAMARSWAGWASDAELEKPATSTPGDDRGRQEAHRRAGAEVRATQVGTHAILGEYKNPAAVRKNIWACSRRQAWRTGNIQKK